MSEKILDAFPDFLDKFRLLAPLVQQLFVMARDKMKQKHKKVLADIAQLLKMEEGEASLNLLENRLANIMQE